MSPREDGLQPEDAGTTARGGHELDGGSADTDGGPARTLGVPSKLAPEPEADGLREDAPDQPPTPIKAPIAGRLREACEQLQQELVEELSAMAHHLASSGSQMDAGAVELLRRAQAGETPEIDELVRAHQALAAQVAPATPRAIRALNDDQRVGGLRNMLGPTPPVRRLALANLLFALMFFGLSISPRINHETIALSIYDQSGPDLVFKLFFMMSAAGLGAGFGALFEIWQDIHEGRFDPAEESTHWMRIGLGIVAGLVLSEIVHTQPTTGGTGVSAVGEPLIALVGGFSASLVHLVVTRLVSAIENTFEPRPRRGPAAPPRPPAVYSDTAPARGPASPPAATAHVREESDWAG